MVEQQKRQTINPPDEKLQTVPYKTGRALTRQREADEEKRRLAIESGRLKKRSLKSESPKGPGGPPRKKKKNKLAAL